ncbi:hypothetical protein NMYAN_10419 [Nitrosomonas nitrosa]|uniref:Uncharacterized protein n=1 Tax=Nitrosomonas nitrosa TaxID=52442 RepID=A0A8H8YX25_9PROT|nr:hypothetical protein NMYAN_10419 [Nitrosomonas nitrosa]
MLCFHKWSVSTILTKGSVSGFTIYDFSFLIYLLHSAMAGAKMKEPTGFYSGKEALSGLIESFTDRVVPIIIDMIFKNIFFFGKAHHDRCFHDQNSNS